MKNTNLPALILATLLLMSAVPGVRADDHGNEAAAAKQPEQSPVIAIDDGATVPQKRIPVVIEAAGERPAGTCAVVDDAIQAFCNEHPGDITCRYVDAGE